MSRSKSYSRYKSSGLKSRKSSKPRERPKPKKSKGPIPKDKKLYEKIKARVQSRMPTHSAYRSGIIVAEYKKAYAEVHGRGSPYSGKKPSTTGLSRWYRERWRNQRGGVGYSRKGDIYRPTRRITKKTPTTHRELSRDEVKRAMREKKRTGRVWRFSSRSQSRRL